MSTHTATVDTTASTALAFLLKEDPLLKQFNLTSLSNTTTNNKDAPDVSEDESAFAYAAALINAENSWISSTSDEGIGDASLQQKANDALGEVDRKLALVESLAERISREKPEHVAGPLLHLHGFSSSISSSNQSNDVERSHEQDESIGQSNNPGVTLVAVRERCDRLSRQSQVLDSVAKRVESTLMRGLNRMELATAKLERVLHTSQVLKKIMGLHFEAKKVTGSGLNFEALKDENVASLSYAVDLRDLTRAAGSVAVIEELLNHPDLKGQNIEVVEKMRPEAEKVARSVRKAAAGLLAEQHMIGDGRIPSATKLGATLQVYYHLGELPDASWSAVSLGLDRAEQATGNFLNPSAIQRLIESAKKDAKLLSERDVDIRGMTDKKKQSQAYDEIFQKKMKEKRADAAAKWASSISESALQVWNLHRVLVRKCDAVSRENFLEVVNASPVPSQFTKADRLLKNHDKEKSQGQNSLFSLFWYQMCISLGARIEKLLKYENGKIAADVVTFYPSIRAAALDMLNSIQDTMQAGNIVSNAALMDDMATSGSVSRFGIMGGSAGLDDALFYKWAQDDSGKGSPVSVAEDYGGSSFGAISADTWTKVDSTAMGRMSIEKTGLSSTTMIKPSSVLSSVLSSPEWLVLQGFDDVGLYPLQRSFMSAMNERLQKPMRSMFVDNEVVDENAIAVSVLPSLPSTSELKMLEKNFRDELSLADPRQGGGELSMTTMISENIVELVEAFCDSARNSTSGAPEDKLLHKNGAATDELLHDMSIATIMATFASSVRSLPENTFVVPYRPTHSLLHEEASSMCAISLLPALHEIESLVKSQIVSPLCRVLNRRIASAISKVHHGTYLESASDEDDGSFVQNVLIRLFDNIANNIFTHLPPSISSILASTVTTFSIYCFVSNVSLVRPLGERTRLRITRDLADIELTLEQFIFKAGGLKTLQQIDDGKPYAELRAVRQMLFWSGLDNTKLSSESVAKEFLREVWVKDVRPSTALHYLFSFAPPLLSSPYHSNGTSKEDYVYDLVKLDGSTDDGEAKCWMTTMTCCDAYQQRESIDHRGIEGDRRIATILMIVGPELLRRRRH